MRPVNAATGSTTGSYNRHLKHTAVTIEETQKERLLVRVRRRKNHTKINVETLMALSSVLIVNQVLKMRDQPASQKQPLGLRRWRRNTGTRFKEAGDFGAHGQLVPAVRTGAPNGSLIEDSKSAAGGFGQGTCDTRSRALCHTTVSESYNRRVLTSSAWDCETLYRAE